MKLALISLLCAASAFAAEAPKPAAPKAAAPASRDAYKSDEERTIYTIGFLMGRNVTAFGLSPAEIKILQAGFGDAAGDAPAKIDVRFYQPMVNDMLSKRMGVTVQKEKDKGRIFTEKFVKDMKPQAILGGGWYLETAAGTGAIPGKTDVVQVNYRGTTVDGAQFDASRGAPTEFSLNGVIACWTNGFGMMKTGGKAKLVCPSDVAYGDPGRPGIKPGATLVFEVELVGIIKPEAPKK